MVAVSFVSTMAGDPWGGSEQLWADVAQRMAERGHEVQACTMHWRTPSSRLAELAAAGVAMSTWRPTGRARRALMRVGILHQRFRLKQSDVLVCNQGGTYDMLNNRRLGYTAAWMRAAGAPYLIAVHSNNDRSVSHEARARLRAYYCNAAAVVLPSSRMRGDIERQIAAPLPRSVTIVTPTPLLRRPATPYPAGAQLRLASIGRLDVVQKGQDVLLGALARVSWRDEDWCLDIYGSGPDEAYLRQLSSFYDISDRVIFHGHDNDIAAIWDDHQVLVMPSRSEARGISITEAMACARPTVGSAVGGIPESVVDGKTGILATAPTIEAWIVALERLWGNRHRLAEWGQQARALAEKTFRADPVESFSDLIIATARTRLTGEKRRGRVRRPLGAPHTKAN